MQSVEWRDLLGTVMCGRDFLHYSDSHLVRGPIREIVVDPENEDFVLVRMQWCKQKPATAKVGDAWQPSSTTEFRLPVMHFPETSGNEMVVFRSGRGKLIAQIMAPGDHIR